MPRYAETSALTWADDMAVELKKSGEKVSLKKGGAQLGEVLINLNWNQGSPKKKGFLASLTGANRGVDLDLGCLFELKDGSKGVIQALGNSFGSLSSPPYISLDGDDRTGASAGGENLRVNGAFASMIKRILVYTFIYEGAANWQQVDGIVTVKCPGNDDIIVRMDEHGSQHRLCVISLIENVDGDSFSVQKVVKFFESQSYADRAYNWGMQWAPGRK